MADTDLAIEQRFKELIEQGNQVFKIHSYNPSSSMHKWHSHPTDQEYNAFFTSGKNLLLRIVGNENVYGQQMDVVHKDNKGNTYYYDSLVGIVQAAYHDWKAGMTSNLKSLVAAELLTDFIEQAQHFLELGYKMPAAVIAGSVLEESLLKLCMANGVSIPSKPKVDFLNVELARKGTYNANVQKQITAWAGIRNSAAHGKISEFTDDNVKNMLQGIISFNASYLK